MTSTSAPSSTIPTTGSTATRLQPWCASIKLLPLNPRRARLASLTGLLTGEALTLPYYRNRELKRWAAELAASGRVTRGIAYSSAMAQFMPAGLARRVIDMVDVDSDKWTQYASTQRWPLSWVYAREGRKLAEWEARVAAGFRRHPAGVARRGGAAATARAAGAPQDRRIRERRRCRLFFAGTRLPESLPA